MSRYEKAKSLASGNDEAGLDRLLRRSDRLHACMVVLAFTGVILFLIGSQIVWVLPEGKSGYAFGIIGLPALLVAVSWVAASSINDRKDVLYMAKRFRMESDADQAVQASSEPSAVLTID